MYWTREYILSFTRIVVEHAFGVLKSRFPRLTEISHRIHTNKHAEDIGVITDEILCSFILHNALIRVRDGHTSELLATVSQEIGVRERRENSVLGVTRNTRPNRRQIEQKRQELVARIWSEKTSAN